MTDVCPQCGSKKVEASTILTYYRTKAGTMSANKAQRPHKVKCNNPDCIVEEITYGYGELPEE